MDWTRNLIGHYVETYEWFLLFGGALTAVELVAAEEPTPVKARLRAVLFWAIFIPISVTSAGALSALWARLGLKPLLILPIGRALSWTGAAAIVLVPLAAAMVTDFFFYWFHRAEHAWLWSLHAVHHSIRHLNGTSGYHHVGEGAARFLFMSIPASFVALDTGDVQAFVMMALLLQQSYVHSSTKASLGPLRVLLVDNRFHRIHHSLEPQHFDKNFGACTTLWDRVFGTAHFPRANEWPAVGLAEVDEPQTVREYLDLPLRYRRRDPSVGQRDLQDVPLTAQKGVN